VYGVVRAALSSPQDPTRVTLIYACRSEQDMLLKPEVGGGLLAALCISMVSAQHSTHSLGARVE
jgi:NAD(P)H-flavin reductase